MCKLLFLSSILQRESVTGARLAQDHTVENGMAGILSQTLWPGFHSWPQWTGKIQKYYTQW